MKRKLLIPALLLLGASAFYSCKREGCTDPDSTVYDSKAKKDNGSCVYEGSHVFWYGKATADSLLANGYTSLSYYVDGTLVGSTAASVYFTGKPDCGANSSITVKKDLNGNKTKSYSYSVKDAVTGEEVWKGTLDFNANTCTAFELTWQ